MSRRGKWARERRLPLSSEVSVVAESATGPLVVVAFGGGYPDGSDGNDVAAEMLSVVERAVHDLEPRAVVFDLLALRYSWGDALWSMWQPLRRQSHDHIPSAIVAASRTRKAIVSLLAFVRQTEPIPVFGDREQAFQWFRRLAGSAVLRET